MKKMKSVILSLAVALLMTMVFMPVAHADDTAPDGSQDNPWVLEYGQSLAMDTETYPNVDAWRVSRNSQNYLEMTSDSEQKSVIVKNINSTDADVTAEVVYGPGRNDPRFYILAKAQDADEIKLTFHKNYTVDDPIFDTVTVGNHQTAMIPSEGPERENYTFVGWAMSSTGEAELYPGQDYQVDKLGTPEITFYAVWGQNSSDLTLDYESLTALSEQITYDGTPHELSGVQEGTADANGYLIVGTYKRSLGFVTQEYDAYADISQVKVTATNGGIYHTPVGSAPIYYYRTTRPTGMVRVTGSYIPVSKGELKIDPIEISVKTESATKDADGQPLTADGQISYKVGDTDYAETFGHTDTRIMLIGEDYITIRTSGEQTAPGTCSNTYVYTLEGTSSGNYFVNADKDELGTLHIHGWSEPGYVWSDDNSKVTATRSCSACDKAEAEEVKTTSQVAQQQSCVLAEITMWTSEEFNKAAFKAQTKKVETAKALGHNLVENPKTAIAVTCTKDGKAADKKCSRCGHVEIGAKIKAKGHQWDGGKVTKEATTSATGVKTFKCKGCGTKRTEIIPIKTKAILVAKGIASGKTAVNISWNKVSGADRYVIYFAKCNSKGKEEKCKKVKTVKAGTLKWKKNKLSKNTFYKFYVVAEKKVNGKYKAIATSSVGHFATGNLQGKYTNPQALKLQKTAITLRKGKTATIKGTVSKVKSGKKLGVGHAKTLRFMSNNIGVATVNASGKVTAKGKGTCIIYVQTINGIWKTCKVTVK